MFKNINNTNTKDDARRKNRLHCFCCKYLCAGDSALCNYVLVPFVFFSLLIVILVLGYGMTFEILSGYSVRMTQEQNYNPVNNSTETIFIKKCLNKHMVFCHTELSVGAIIVVVIVEIFFLFCLYSVTTIILVLAHSFIISIKNRRFALDGSLLGLVMCGKRPEKSRLYYIDMDEKEAKDTCFEMCLPAATYWACIPFVLYILIGIHIFSWTGGQYDIINGEYKGKLGVCNTDDIFIPNLRLVEYFWLELLSILGIELIVSIIMLLMYLFNRCTKDFNDNFNKLLNLEQQSNMGDKTKNKVGDKAGDKVGDKVGYKVEDKTENMANNV